MSGSAKPAWHNNLTGPPADARLSELQPLINDMYERSGAAKYDLSPDRFIGIIQEVAQKYLAAEDGPDVARQLLSTLHAEELVLARACAAGSEAAWEAFLTRYREPLYDAAADITHDYGAARDLADSLYSDLYGTETADGAHLSKLNSYMGCGSLEGWLRTILARGFIDRYRSEKRLVSLDEEAEEGVQFAAPPVRPESSVDPRLEQATDDALTALTPEDRYILASFFLHGRTLAEVARTLKVHESTISRRVDKITVTLRKHIRSGMMKRGMSRRQADEAFEADVRDLQINVRARLQENLQEMPAGPSSPQRGKTSKDPQ